MAPLCSSRSRTQMRSPSQTSQARLLPSLITNCTTGPPQTSVANLTNAAYLCHLHRLRQPRQRLQHGRYRSQARDGADHYQYSGGSAELATDVREVRASLQTIFPSIHGVRLAARIDEVTLDKVIGHLRVAHEYDPARANALITEYGDALKTASVREFVLKYDKNPGIKVGHQSKRPR